MNGRNFVHLFLVPNRSRQAYELWNKLKGYLRNLNFFSSIPPSTDEHELRTQRITTRLFIFLLILSMTILVLYTSLITIIKTVHVEAPSLIQCSQLKSTYSTTLAYPCSKTSIKYDKILHVEYTLHQVCTSIFIDQSWIYLLIKTGQLPLHIGDFRLTSGYAFQALHTLCNLINNTISHSLTQFYSNHYISPSIVSLELFQSETESLVNQFRSSMTTSLLSSLSIIRDITQANGLLSGLKTNYILHLADNNGILVSAALSYNDCICSHSSTCSMQSAIMEHLTEQPSFDVPGWRTGCYVIDSLLQSTLECFYSQRCLDALKGYMPGSDRMHIIALNASLSSNYSVNSTIQELVDNLMIERWDLTSKYETYYNECQPKNYTYYDECQSKNYTYTFETRNDMIYMVTTLLGMAGGLTTILQFFLPRLVKFIMDCIQRHRTRVVPEVSVIGHN